MAGFAGGGGEGGKRVTSETVDSPLFELLEGDFGGRGCGVEIQTVRVFLHLVKRMGELFFLVVEDVAAFGVDAVAAGGGRLADHFEIETRAHSLSLSLSPVGPKRDCCFSRVERKEKVGREREQAWIDEHEHEHDRGNAYSATHHAYPGSIRDCCSAIRSGRSRIIGGYDGGCATCNVPLQWDWKKEGYAINNACDMKVCAEGCGTYRRLTAWATWFG